MEGPLFEQVPTIEEIQEAILNLVSQTDGLFARPVIDAVRGRLGVTRTQVSEAMWRLLDSGRVRLTRTLKLKVGSAGRETNC